MICGGTDKHNDGDDIVLITLTYCKNNYNTRYNNNNNNNSISSNNNSINNSNNNTHFSKSNRVEEHEKNKKNLQWIDVIIIIIISMFICSFSHKHADYKILCKSATVTQQVAPKGKFTKKKNEKFQFSFQTHTYIHTWS